MFPFPNFKQGLSNSINHYQSNNSGSSFNSPPNNYGSFNSGPYQHNLQNQNQNIFPLPQSSIYMMTKNYLGRMETIQKQIDIFRDFITEEEDQNQLQQIEKRINNLTYVTINGQKGMNNSTHQHQINSQIEILNKRMKEIQSKYENLQKKHQQLEERMNRMEASMVTREEFEQLEDKCQEKFEFFQNQMQVLKDQNNKLYIYIDQKFQQSLRPGERFVLKLDEYRENNYRVYQYARRIYWGLMNQVLAYRTLSTGLVQKGYIQSKFKEFSNILGEASNILGGVPVVGDILNVVKDISSLFFEKQDEIIIHNMSKRVEGYYMEQMISEDVAQAAILLAQNQKIRKRLFEYKQSDQPQGLMKFLKIIDFAGKTVDKILSKIVRKVAGIKKDQSDSETVTQNVVTDISLIVWKLVEQAPMDQQHPISEAVKKYIECIMEEPEGENANSEWGSPVPQSSERQKFFKLHILRAQLVKSKDIFGKMDPYCVVKYGPIRHQTQVCENGHKTPIWDEQFIIQSAPMTAAITFQVYDSDTIGSDDQIGEGTMIDSQYDENEQVIRLIRKGKLAGQLFVKLHP